MKLFRKAMLAVITMVLAVVAIVVPANRTTKVEAANITGGTTLYLKPGSNWKQANARFAAYFFGDGETWVSMTLASGETDIYEVTAPAGKNFTNVIFCRMNPSTTSNNWNNGTLWNQTNDLTWDGVKNLYTVADDAWSKGSGSWGTYTPSVPGDKTVQLRGTANGTTDWAEGVALVYNYETEKYEATVTFEVGDEYKFVCNGSWYGNGDDNYVVTEAGTYYVWFDDNGNYGVEKLVVEPEVTASIAWQQGTLNDAAALRIVVVLEGLTTENVADFAKEISIKTTHAGIADTQVVDVLFTGVVDLATGDAITGDLYAVLTYTNIPTGEYAIEVLFDEAVVATETATIA